MADSERSDILIHELETTKVVVFLDRAEVTRQLTTKIGKGENEIVVKELSEYLDKESVRVEGKGQGSILDVVVQSNREFTDVDEKKKNEADLEKGKLEEDLKEILRKIEDLKNSKESLENQRKFHTEFGKNFSTKLDKNFDVSSVEAVEIFFNSYGRSQEQIGQKILDIEREIQQLRESACKVQEKIENLFHKVTKRKTRQLSIYIEGFEDGEIEIIISYVVMNASWKPKYDVRVNSADQILKIHYYGLIRQTTEENWNSCKVFLSSATPSVGGNLPKLGNFQLSIHKACPPVSYPRGSKPMVKMMKRASITAEFAPASSRTETFLGTPDLLEESAEVNEFMTSTTYEVSKPATIPSDQIEHKVCIGVRELQAHFEYKTVPRKAAFAYLIAKVTNNSEYAFLPGKSNIFFDNNFVATTDFKSVSPREEFTCDLGRDLSVRVDFKPEKKFKENTGWVHKSTLTKYSQTIVIKNTKAFPVHITVVERIPQTVDDEIKVNLIEPAGLKIGQREKADYSKPIRINKNHNVEWEFDLGSGKEQECILKYSIEHPAAKKIDTTEIFDDNQNL